MFGYGQRVRLRSGGAIMFVCGYDDGGVICAWFGAGGRREAHYPELCLDAVA